MFKGKLYGIITFNIKKKKKAENSLNDALILLDQRPACWMSAEKARPGWQREASTQKAWELGYSAEGTHTDTHGRQDLRLLSPYK